MIAYMIRHKPSGLYYKHSNKDGGTMAMSNLSTQGKVYTKKPTLKHLGATFWWHDKVREDAFQHDVVEGEWEIVTFIMYETTVK